MCKGRVKERMVGLGWGVGPGIDRQEQIWRGRNTRGGGLWTG